MMTCAASIDLKNLVPLTQFLHSTPLRCMRQSQPLYVTASILFLYRTHANTGVFLNSRGQVTPGLLGRRGAWPTGSTSCLMRFTEMRYSLNPTGGSHSAV